MSEHSKFLADLLPKSAHTKIPAILSYFGQAEATHEVDVVGARVPVETVEAYGLLIGVDANGNAATITFPHGAEAWS
ncbi:hypothetical protein OG423_14275 [Micromonospora zamorensis]|uniref:hypothetical protein n=1 Tax=Micromonospora zamorensis TaxID=709883 RepID=UPI00352A9336|nr:hypothetical protein OG423_14275 [Micromonospora zamorensis]